MGSMTTGRLVSRTGYTAIFPSIGLSMSTVLVFALAHYLALNHSRLHDFWRGFVLPRLLERMAPLWSSLLLGLAIATVKSGAGLPTSALAETAPRRADGRRPARAVRRTSSSGAG